MKKDFNHILCATDLSDLAGRGAAYGVAVARAFNAKLFLCHVVDLPSISIAGGHYVYADGLDDSLRAYAETEMQKLMENEDVDWEPLIASGAVVDKIAAWVVEKNIDLAISATHGRSGLKRLMIGSVTARLMRTVTCPFFMVTPPAQPIDSSAILRFKRIMVGCDFSDHSERALSYAFSLAQEFQADIHLVHVLEPATFRGVYTSEAIMTDVDVNLHDRIIDRLEKLAPDDVRHWCHVETACLTGIPFKELTNYTAENKIDMAVMGLRGVGLVESLLVGSTTDRLLRHISCPLLSVGPAPSD